MKVNPIIQEQYMFRDANAGDVFCMANEWPVRNIYMKVGSNTGTQYVNLLSGSLANINDVTNPIHIFFNAYIDLCVSPNERNESESDR